MIFRSTLAARASRLIITRFGQWAGWRIDFRRRFDLGAGRGHGAGGFSVGFEHVGNGEKGTGLTRRGRWNRAVTAMCPRGKDLVTNPGPRQPEKPRPIHKMKSSRADRVAFLTLGKKTRISSPDRHLSAGSSPASEVVAMRPIQSFLLVSCLSGLLIAAGTMNAEDGAAQPASTAANSDASRLERARKAMAEGKYQEAKDEYEAIVQSDVQTLGAEAPQTLSDRLELAVVKGKSGDSIKAEDEIRLLLAIFTRRNGPDHDQTLNCQTALARFLDDFGRSHEAVKEYRHILESRERLLGPDHIESGRVRHMLGDALTNTRDYAEAIQQFQKAEAIFERVLGPENPETLLNRSNLALAEGEHQEYEAAEKELKAVLEIRERLSGANDISVLMTCYHLARVLGGRGQFEEALTYATRAKEGLRGVLAPSSLAVTHADQLCAEVQADLANQQVRKAK